MTEDDYKVLALQLYGTDDDHVFSELDCKVDVTHGGAWVQIWTWIPETKEEEA